MEIGLRLLMRDGLVHIRFQPPLTGEQYTELLDATKEPTTKAELRMAVRNLARSWGSQVIFDEP